jgi:phosphoglycerate dehydrogenase-like enzyme
MRVAIAPEVREEFALAVTTAGAELAELDESVKGLVWTDYSRPQLLRETLDANPQLEWVQLPFAGVDAFADLFTRAPLFTSAKGAYSEPVAEHALALSLALARALPRRILAKTWGEKFAVSLYESRVLIVGAGGIAKELTQLLAPFACPVTVLGSKDIDRLHEELPLADFVVLACALTERTRGLFDSIAFASMKKSAYLVNVARGGVVETQALIEALEGGQIAGAGIDVTDPEPLPDGHPLWNAPNLIITPHTADTDAQVIRMFAERINQNVKAFCGSGEWVGVVDKQLGY